MSVPSPCIKVCSIDPVTGWCIGCGRSRREISGWARMTEPQQEEVIMDLALRPRPAFAPAAVPMDCAVCGACAGRGAPA